MLTNIPSSIVSGSTVTFTKKFEVYTADFWSLAYYLVGAARAESSFAVNADGISFDVTLVAISAPSTPLPVGNYYFQAYVTYLSDPTDKRLVDSGQIKIIADLSSNTVTSFDGRSNAESMVAAIDAVMQKKATHDQQSYTIGQRTLVRMPMDQLLEWRKYYVGIVEAEYLAARREAGLPIFQNILTVFRSPR